MLLRPRRTRSCCVTYLFSAISRPRSFRESFAQRPEMGSENQIMRIKILFCTLILLSVHRSNATDETYAAMRSGDTERVQALLAKGISPNQHDDRSNTLLMQAAVYGHADALKLLMDKGADVNATNNAGATAL